jgi:HD-GYP domain-containing protein (c-di-GMP phosphodiesterase class II)
MAGCEIFFDSSQETQNSDPLKDYFTFPKTIDSTNIDQAIREINLFIGRGGVRIKTERLIHFILGSYDRNTEIHSINTAKVATELGYALIEKNSGIKKEFDIHDLEMAGLFHDFGKTCISKNILNKPGKLTPKEFEEIKTHPTQSFMLLQNVSFINPPTLMAIFEHHEKYDGTGYPRKIAGKDISLMGRIIAIADVYDALTSERSYHSKYDPKKAISLMSGKQFTGYFDPEILNVFVESRLAIL